MNLVTYMLFCRILCIAAVFMIPATSHAAPVVIAAVSAAGSVALSAAGWSFIAFAQQLALNLAVVAFSGVVSRRGQGAVGKVVR